MPPTTCYGYKRRYRDVESIKKQIIIHGKCAGVIISDNNDGPELLMDDFIKASPKQVSRKRPRIQAQPVQVIIPVLNDQAAVDVVDGTKQPMEQAQALVQTAEQSMEQAPMQLDVDGYIEVPMIQEVVHTAEQPMEQALVRADDVAPVPMDAAPVPSVIFNGVHEPLVLNGLVIEVDPDTLMVNATMMCRAAGRLFGDYHRQKKTEEYLSAISLDIGIPITDLIKSNRGGNNSGTMVHRLIAYDLASWLSQDVKLQFYKRNDELRIENATLSTKIEELQANAADSTSTNAIAPPSAHLPNVNGGRRVVPTNTLVLNGLVIEVDPVTFMINATQMCQAAGKRWVDYRKNNTTEGYLKAIESKVRIITFDLIRSKPGHNGGTMVHLLIALDLASWLSPEVKLQFNMWNAELLLTGRVELGNEMNAQQLEEIWKRLVDEVKAKASADVSAAQDRCQEIILQKNELELRLATIQDAHQRSDEEKNALVAIKVREDLEAAIQFQVNTTAPTIATYKEGDNVLYLARIDETKFKYGHTKNLKQRLEAHRRPGVYPTLELVWIVKSNNGVASEDQLHAYVKKKKIIAEYGTQREVIVLKSVDDLERMLKKMNKCALPRADADIDMKRMEEETKRMEITEKTKQMEINAKTKQMEINAKTMLLQMLASKTITVEQYLQIKD
jgi:hypothetical protein